MAAKTGKQSLRIIAGAWRSRRIQFAANPALRPTPDRVRETLFNWLMPVIDGARCLDLFCGSGILGLEALSRGAEQVVFVDQHRESIQALRDNCQLLGARSARFVEMDVLRYLQGNKEPFDLVFVDPPYQATDLLTSTCRLLQDNQWLAPNAFVYVEHDQHFDTSGLPSTWQRHRHKQAGQVNYALYKAAN